MKNKQLPLKAFRHGRASYPALIHNRVWIWTVKLLGVEKKQAERVDFYVLQAMRLF
jgi:hypothetical protein